MTEGAGTGRVTGEGAGRGDRGRSSADSVRRCPAWIPAFAGMTEGAGAGGVTGEGAGRGDRGRSSADSVRRGPDWIPAFAGMTEGEVAHAAGPWRVRRGRGGGRLGAAPGVARANLRRTHIGPPQEARLMSFAQDAPGAVPVPALAAGGALGPSASRWDHPVLVRSCSAQGSAPNGSRALGASEERSDPTRHRVSPSSTPCLQVHHATLRKPLQHCERARIHKASAGRRRMARVSRNAARMWLRWCTSMPVASTM